MLYFQLPVYSFGSSAISSRVPWDGTGSTALGWAVYMESLSKNVIVDISLHKAALLERNPPSRCDRFCVSIKHWLSRMFTGVHHWLWVLTANNPTLLLGVTTRMKINIYDNSELWGLYSTSPPALWYPTWPNLGADHATRGRFAILTSNTPTRGPSGHARTILFQYLIFILMGS